MSRGGGAEHRLAPSPPLFWPTQKYFDSRADIGTQGSAFLEFGKHDVMYCVGAVYFKIFTAVPSALALLGNVRRNCRKTQTKRACFCDIENIGTIKDYNILAQCSSCMSS